MTVPFGIYIHWPFCAAKCPYCDFNSHVRQSIDHDAWRQSFTAELEYYARLTGGRTVSSVFFGGGTPSLMEPETAETVLETIDRLWTVEPDAEITLEANPTSVEIRKFRDFKNAGINRVSVGIQALNDADLRFLGRAHTADEALAAFDMARKTFDRYTFDLIYARPDQSVQEWEEELTRALSYAGGHVSLYQLTIERGTPFYLQHKRGEFSIPDEDLAGDLYDLTRAIMEEAGLPAYEVSNHARPGEESHHNLVYWRYGDYLGIGPGAHGRITKDTGEIIATRGHRVPKIWMKNIDQAGHGGHDFETIDSEQALTEALMMGLRLREGVSLKALSRRADIPWNDVVSKSRIEKSVEKGFLSFDGDRDRIRPTETGMVRLNSLLGYLLA